jgi:transcriptional regulator with XRE-family HTH domain
MRIKEVIKEQGITIKDVANKMGVSRPSLNQTINGNPTVEMLERIAAALNVPVAELFDKPKDNTTELLKSNPVELNTDNLKDKQTQIQTFERVAEALGVPLSEVFNRHRDVFYCPHCGGRIKVGKE